MGLITILSENRQPLADYGFNGGVISFGGVMYFVKPLTSYGFIGGVIIGGISSLKYTTTQ